ncbi:hypothetical protein ACHAW5_000929 [Stephanodiscus triporus]|uniref:Rit1 DUSP-like domain-containing protein n=1 Tax=Stephanodiscus triporus TaxID=2934178 RepID=A0ABD3MY74_9STRA
MWCCVMNRLVLRYRTEMMMMMTMSSSYSGGSSGGGDILPDWDTGLHTPHPVVSMEEHDEMSRLIDSRVEALYASGAIVDPKRLVETMTRPNEYPNMLRSVEGRTGARGRYYLQLPVKEGKRDRHELERWLPVGLVFLAHHMQRRDARVLVHCAQGRDRSVAIAIAFVALFCPPSYPPRLRPNFETLNFKSMTDSPGLVEEDDFYLQSGLGQSLVDALLRDGGKDLFLTWMHRQLNVSAIEPFADKNKLRIVLHLVRQDREKAEPTRSTLQKLNRFFMSSPMYRSLE